MSENKNKALVLVPPLVVVDTDPGTDDALALYMLLAADKRKMIKLVAVTCVDGNTSVHHGTRNALRVLQSVDRLDVPVFKGAVEPLIVEPVPKDESRVSHAGYHGEDGFGGAKFDKEPDLGLIQNKTAVAGLTDLARQYKGRLSLVCVGPLTNVALAIKSDPEFAGNIKDIFVMGGNMSGVGNVTSCAEFNFFHDPEAAHIVLANAQSHITLVPWEPTKAQGMSYEWREKVFGKANTKQIELLNKIEQTVNEKSKNPSWIPCDSFITAAFIDPSIITKLETYHLTVELHGVRTRGQVVIDHLRKCDDNVKLIKEVDLEKFKQLMYMAVDHPNCVL
ncbi:inosine-uridine preferring nucleoside hydrolase-like [Neocloeon triangulifer]|uniref:inosine-uridine preferring nucleoside hydrolase-like n=1 Tax=Neocloeon triangulifer TaxID=2078957 RepID=UPI00286F4EE2|nr:inosine-uridine preferring nucleoside hydrolase-like [Neocloeon triangulifer]